LVFYTLKNLATLVVRPMYHIWCYWPPNDDNERRAFECSLL
jgi:hypothetical protein